MKFIYNILMLPLRLFKYLNPFYYIGLFIKWTVIIILVGGVSYSYLMDDNQKQNIKNKVKKEASKELKKQTDKISSKVVDMSSDAFDNIKDEYLEDNFENILEDITNKKIEEISSEYTSEELINMGRDRFFEMIDSEVKKELQKMKV